MNKLLSIIVPVYNEKNTIEAILKRVSNVDLGEIGKEIIIVDDGSTDGTSEILKQLPEREGLKIFLQPKNALVHEPKLKLIIPEEKPR